MIILFKSNESILPWVNTCSMFQKYGTSGNSRGSMSTRSFFRLFNASNLFGSTKNRPINFCFDKQERIR